MGHRPISLSTEAPDALVRRFMDFHECRSLHTITPLEEIYTQDVEFIGPLKRINGMLALKHHYRDLAQSLAFYQIRYHDSLVGEHSAYISWEVDCAHPRVARGRPVTLRGMTHIRFTARVYYQEDAYDVGALLYDQIPGLASLTGFLRRRLARQ